ncbi:MAG: methylmalonyl-CoA epimerase [Desulfobacteraceae bacterium]|nr:methylmalonyl-CoA epimerase [Desulfobacteraceae bacterium]MBC2749224.1 VOC family protein [Desulfobacteraceae bacterium]
MIIDHIGIVVKNIVKGIAHWEEVFGYKQATKVVENTRQKVKVVFLQKEGSIAIKLTEPTSDSSPIYKFALKGGGLHHLCFKCNQIDDEISRLKDIGLRLLAKPEPGEAFENEKIAFIYAKNRMNIELIDTNKKADKII